MFRREFDLYDSLLLMCLRVKKERFMFVPDICCMCRVRSLVQTNDCLAAMSVGNLKNRGLDGELLVTGKECSNGHISRVIFELQAP